MEPYIECSFIEMKFNNNKYLIGGIYRVPNTGIDKFLEELNSIIEPLKSSHKLILLGDYNINLLKDDKHKNDFELSLQSNYLIPTILSATRVEIKIKNNQEVLSATLIDNILINYDMKYQSGIIETSITDHYSIYILHSSLYEHLLCSYLAMVIFHRAVNTEHNVRLMSKHQLSIYMNIMFVIWDLVLIVNLCHIIQFHSI